MAHPLLSVPRHNHRTVWDSFTGYVVDLDSVYKEILVIPAVLEPFAAPKTKIHTLPARC
jgi:hypothetical protein